MSVINSIPLIAAGDDGYQISRSVRLRSSASAYLNRTMTASFTSKRIFTFSFWCKRGTLSTAQSIFDRNQSTNVNQFAIGFNTDNTFQMAARTSGTSTVSLNLTTSAVFRDPSAWYHFFIAVDNTQATLANRGQIYVNGVLQTLGTQTATQNVDYHLLTGLTYDIGRTALTASQYFDGYLTEFNFIDGQQLTPSSFGETNAITGVWQPKKYAGTYGTNGFYLNFSDNSGATATTIGKDNSGNGNNWTPNNISVTAGVTYDSMLDVPTPFADRGNYATLNPLDTATAMQASLASGNLELNANTASGGSGNSRATIAVDSGKWYFEATLSGYAGSSNLRAGWDTAIASVGTGSSGITGAYKEVSSNQTVIIAVDLNNLLAWVGSNGTWDAGDPSAGTGGTSISLSGYLAVPFVRDNSGTAGNGGKWSVNFGQRPFTYTPPTGFKALNTQNLPAPTISNGASYMAATTFNGITGGTQTLTNTVNGVGFQPDFVWMKLRSGVQDHFLVDSVRGSSNILVSNSTAAEITGATTFLTSFNSNGWSLGSGGYGNGVTVVGWQWNAGGSTVTNTDGSISAQVRANPTAGFSVCTFNVGASGAKTFGHGLGVAPKMVIVKSRTSALGWCTYHASATTTTSQYLQINLTSAVLSVAGIWGSTLPTSTLVGIGSGTNVNVNDDCVAYCFAPVAGYSAFGSYTGNGSTDGPFVFLGFRPRWVMIKGSSDADRAWVMLDTSRNTANVMNLNLYANASDAEATDTRADVLSNGFKVRATGTWVNNNASTYIYMAFAENPLKLSLAR